MSDPIVKIEIGGANLELSISEAEDIRRRLSDAILDAELLRQRKNDLQFETYKDVVTYLIYQRNMHYRTVCNEAGIAQKEGKTPGEFAKAMLGFCD